ncbi:MAG: hypothetical protein AAF602_05160 [Myxococcota bacterium]
MPTSPSPDKPRKPTPNGRVKPHPSAFDVGAPIEACAVGSGRFVAVTTHPGDDETPPATVCQVYEAGDAGWQCIQEIPAPPGLHRLRTSGDQLVACLGTDRVFTSSRGLQGWGPLAPLPLPEVFEEVRDVLLQGELLVVDAKRNGFAIYERSHGRWVLRHQAPARALKRLGRPLAVNPRHDILVRLGGGFAILARDAVGGWTKGPPLKIAPLYRGWSPPTIDTVHFTDDALALGAPRDATDAPGHGGSVTGRTLPASGTVFVSGRCDDGTWTPFATLLPPRPRASGQFGSILGGTADGALLVASRHEHSPALRAFVFARDVEGAWQLRTQLADVPAGWMDMDDATVFHVSHQGGSVALHRFGDDLLDVPLPKRSTRRRVRRPTAEVTYLVPDEEGGMGELLAASGELVAVTVGAAVHLLRFESPDGASLVTEHVVNHEDELVPGALAVDDERVAIVWEDLGDRVATPQIFARHQDGTWHAEPMGAPRGEDGGWAEPCIALRGDWLVYGRRGDADGHPSYLCGWRRTAGGWSARFEVSWPRSPHSIALDDEALRLLVASEWEDRVEVCALGEDGPGPPTLVTAEGGPAVFHGEVVLVGRRDGIQVFGPEGSGWQPIGTVPLSREVTDDLVADGDHVYAASSLVGGVGAPTGEVHVLRRGEHGYASCLAFRDYCQGVDGYDVGGTLAVAGRRALVGFEHRFHHLGGIQIALLDGLEVDRAAKEP